MIMEGKYMEQEYCIIYGYNDNDPGPFVIGVTKDQNMINGFREEHYQFCKGGEVVVDTFYDNLSSDYEITYSAGHYLTPKMITDFMQFLTAEYNQISMLVDNLSRDIEYLKFNETEQDILSDGIGFLHEILYDVSYGVHMDNRYGTNDQIMDSIYANILDVPKCLDKFLSTYQPTADIF